ncbi:MAG: putative transcriptional regulator, partial [Clostridia bacterium]|nr:putative transcriptional regulator [Clostridia bacterium]
SCSYGAQAFRDWAEDIEKNRYDGLTPESFNQWRDYCIYVCIYATNSSCREFLRRAAEFNPGLPYFKEVFDLYSDPDGIGRRLEEAGGGFSVTLDNLKDKEKRKNIISLLREYAGLYDRISAAIPK